MYPLKNEGLIGVSGKADDPLQLERWGKSMDIGSEGKGREESTSKPVQMSKEGKFSLEWGTGEGGGASMGPWTPWAQQTP